MPYTNGGMDLAKWLTEQQVGKIVEAARTFVEGARAGKRSVKIGKVTHAPQEVGMCARFVRECVEAGTGLAEYAWLEPDPGNARQMAAQLRERGYSRGNTSDLRPGDILYRGTGTHGHIALYVGALAALLGALELIAENTSASDRGFPRRAGTKYTPRGVGDGKFGEWEEVFRLTAPAAVSGGSGQGTGAAPSAPSGGQQWQFKPVLEPSGDIVCKGMATQFNDHTTRTGIPADRPGLIACSLPRGLCAATRGSGFEGVPDLALVRVHCEATRKTIVAVVIDEGPAWRAQAGTGEPGGAMIDLTPAAARALGLKAKQNAQVRIRVLKQTEAAGITAADLLAALEAKA